MSWPIHKANHAASDKKRRKVSYVLKTSFPTELKCLKKQRNFEFSVAPIDENLSSFVKKIVAQTTISKRAIKTI